MRAGGDHATAEQERLALYLMGALDDAERESFETHLAGCWHCLDEAAAIGPSISGLAGLGDADWSLPTDEPSLSTPSTDAGPVPSVPTASADAGPPLPAPPVAAGPPQPAPPVAAAPPQAASDPDASTLGVAPGVDSPQHTDPPATAAGTGGAPAGPGRGGEAGAGPVRPTGSRPGARRPASTRPASTAASRRRRRALWAGAAALVLALAGGVAVVNEWTSRPDPVLIATGEAPGYGASLSVVITEGERGGATIRITASGLRQGTRYRLFAVTRDGATHAIRDWTATSGPQEVAGETSLPVDQLSFITVGLTDGSAIVTAPIAQSPASPR
ncbi:zf-HC2 domain-containing protein [Micromonospora zingiberis]|uniref:Zf-HC2 domain-containing protein n=1 Tax=Micromonospora zingiberis TaxID=2053011 RepID=A0A4R0GMK3_9ACTN|nr:zf-HC2 domain-containing protein [Micromonospora zingiberis]TCB96789.1 zf-HC2 domain-containing protein [Micromonospora zingiberis]